MTETTKTTKVENEANPESDAIEICATQSQAEIIMLVLIREGLRLRGLKSLPRGMTPGDVLDSITACGEVADAIAHSLPERQRKQPGENRVAERRTLSAITGAPDAA